MSAYAVRWTPNETAEPAIAALYYQIGTRVGLGEEKFIETYRLMGQGLG